MAHHFEAKATVTNRFWGTTSRSKQRQHIVIGAPLRNQSNGNKLFILALAHQTQDQSNGNSLYILVWGHHFEAKAAAANHSIGAPQSNGNESGQHWSTTSRRKQRQQIVRLCIGAPLRVQRNSNKMYTLALGHQSGIPTQRQQIVHLRIGAPLRDQSNGNKSYILTLGHHFETKATATNRTSQHWGTTSRPKQRQPNFGNGTPLRDQSNSKLYILALRHHFETKETANCILALRNHFETKATATNRTS